MSTFFERLEKGLPYQQAVADLMVEDGIPCVTDTTLRTEGVVDDADLDCGGFLVEVKSLTARFTGPEDWPFHEVFIDTVSTWDRKVRERLAIIMLSKTGGGLAVLPVESSKSKWYVTRKNDTQRRMLDDFYAVSKDHLVSYDDLLRYLRAALKLETPPPKPVVEKPVIVHPFCKAHASHFCPCCKPGSYNLSDPRDREYWAGWDAQAPIVPIGEQ